MEEGEIHPALPKLVDCPGSTGSISVTCAPRRCKCQAQEAPTMPAPTTMQCGLFGLMLTGPVHTRHEPLQHRDDCVRSFLRPVGITPRHQSRHL